jgi:hypothetical protein
MFVGLKNPQGLKKHRIQQTDLKKYFEELFMMFQKILLKKFIGLRNSLTG